MPKKIKLLNIDEVKRGVEQLLKDESWTLLKAEENPNDFINRFNKIFGKHLKYIPYLIKLLEIKDKPFKFYRIRRVNEKFNADLISTHGSPTSDVSLHFQRANIPNFPVFYGSENPGTAIYELLQQKQVNKKDDFVLSEWTFRKNSKIRICPFIFSESTINWIQGYTSNLIDEIKNQVLVGFSKDEKEGFIEALRFLSKLFIEERSKPITSFLAHANLYANHLKRAEVFIYPSVQTERKSVNFAIHPNCIHHKAILKNLYKIKLGKLDYDKGTYQIAVLSAGENKEGIIHWYTVDKNGNSEHSGLKEMIKRTR